MTPETPKPGQLPAQPFMPIQPKPKQENLPHWLQAIAVIESYFWYGVVAFVLYLVYLVVKHLTGAC